MENHKNTCFVFFTHGYNLFLFVLKSPQNNRQAGRDGLAVTDWRLDSTLVYTNTAYNTETIKHKIILLGNFVKYFF